MNFEKLMMQLLCSYLEHTEKKLVLQSMEFLDIDIFLKITLKEIYFDVNNTLVNLHLSINGTKFQKTNTTFILQCKCLKSHVEKWPIDMMPYLEIIYYLVAKII